MIAVALGVTTLARGRSLVEVSSGRTGLETCAVVELLVQAHIASPGAAAAAVAIAAALRVARAADVVAVGVGARGAARDAVTGVFERAAPDAAGPEGSAGPDAAVRALRVALGAGPGGRVQEVKRRAAVDAHAVCDEGSRAEKTRAGEPYVLAEWTGGSGRCARFKIQEKKGGKAPCSANASEFNTRGPRD